jgi:hypothetical protein
MRQHRTQMTGERMLLAECHPFQLLGDVLPIQFIEFPLTDRAGLREEPGVGVFIYGEAA